MKLSAAPIDRSEDGPAFLGSDEDAHEWNGTERTKTEQPAGNCGREPHACRATAKEMEQEEDIGLDRIGHGDLLRFTQVRTGGGSAHGG